MGIVLGQASVNGLILVGLMLIVIVLFASIALLVAIFERNMNVALLCGWILFLVILTYITTEISSHYQTIISQ